MRGTVSNDAHDIDDDNVAQYMQQHWMWAGLAVIYLVVKLLFTTILLVAGLRLAVLGRTCGALPWPFTEQY